MEVNTGSPDAPGNIPAPSLQPPTSPDAEAGQGEVQGEVSSSTPIREFHGPRVEVLEILEARYVGGRNEYLVAWEDGREGTWEGAEVCRRLCPGTLARFKALRLLTAPDDELGKAGGLGLAPAPARRRPSNTKPLQIRVKLNLEPESKPKNNVSKQKQVSKTESGQEDGNDLFSTGNSPSPPGSAQASADPPPGPPPTRATLSLAKGLHLPSPQAALLEHQLTTLNSPTEDVRPPTKRPPLLPSLPCTAEDVQKLSEPSVTVEAKEPPRKRRPLLPCPDTHSSSDSSPKKRRRSGEKRGRRMVKMGPEMAASAASALLSVPQLQDRIQAASPAASASSPSTDKEEKKIPKDTDQSLPGTEVTKDTETSKRIGLTNPKEAFNPKMEAVSPKPKSILKKRPVLVPMGPVPKTAKSSPSLPPSTAEYEQRYREERVKRKAVQKELKDERALTASLQTGQSGSAAERREVAEVKVELSKLKKEMSITTVKLKDQKRNNRILMAKLGERELALSNAKKRLQEEVEDRLRSPQSAVDTGEEKRAAGSQQRTGLEEKLSAQKLTCRQLTEQLVEAREGLRCAQKQIAEGPTLWNQLLLSPPPLCSLPSVGVQVERSGGMGRVLGTVALLLGERDREIARLTGLLHAPTTLSTPHITSPM